MKIFYKPGTALYAYLQELWQDKRKTSEVFILSNFAFLSIDIYTAHYVNHFSHGAEWIPFVFSIIASIILTFAFFQKSNESFSFYTHTAIASLSILIGILGVYYHLESQFFEKLTLASLVYTAPFIAPLSYVGLGFLLLINKMVKEEAEWAQWVIFFAYGGFWGIFILSLCDHEQNAFFHVSEWIPVVASAIALGFLSVFIFVCKVPPKLFLYTRYLMYAMLLVGFLGFVLHLQSSWKNFSYKFFPNFVYGAPLFAPLLFSNIAILSLIGLEAKLGVNSESE